MTTGLEGVKGDSDSNYSCIVFSTDKRASLFNRDLRVVSCVNCQFCLELGRKLMDHL